MREVIVRIVYLVFASNSAYVQVVRRKPKGVKIDVAKKKWTYEHAHHRQSEPIGNGCFLGDRRMGVIGVYDLDKLEHADSMVHDALESQRNRSHTQD
ncbi:MAG: hypothetical protein NUV60_02770 [Patescibacteria group bacterium]|nr:hypothetical protein [Patescibacteria group bacterium]